MRKLLHAKDAFYPVLKNYSHQETQLLHLKLSIDVKNIPIGGQQYYWMDSEVSFLSDSFSYKFWRFYTFTTKRT
jgi:hypothetical protein